MSDKNKITWTTLAFMAFSTRMGFGNIVNGFVYFNGVQVIFSWLLMVRVVLCSVRAHGW